MSNHNVTQGSDDAHILLSASDKGKVLGMAKKRAQEYEEFERKKQKLEGSANRSVKNIKSSFSSSRMEKIEATFTQHTVGLVSREDFLKKRDQLKRDELVKGAPAGAQARTGAAEQPKKKVKDKKKFKRAALLTFQDEADETEEQAAPVVEKPVEKRAVGKNPLVNTSFLPDREREKEELEVRSQLIDEWQREQERLKKEVVEITFSYWDGAGHRRSIKVCKGDTIGNFLEKARQKLSHEFRDLARSSVENLMFIKEDLIIPQSYSFYDLIVTKARGKSGPLFKFDVHDDVRLRNDATVEKDETHAGKIVERHWYERNKHIFPASRWEVYDPEKSFETYTIHGHEVR